MQSQSARRPRAAHPHHTTGNFTPRGLRPKIWFNTAYEAAKARGLPAVQAAKVALETTNGPRVRINDAKQSVEGLLRRSTDQARMHYGEIARGLPHSLDSALVEVERAYRAEISHVANLDTITHGSRHHGMCLTRVERLRNVRIILRLMRFTGHTDAFPEMREAVAAAIPLVEAFRAFHQVVRPVRGR
jgi:hypothetical protein